ncbi:putative glycoside hydrolase superfamily [Septoria linicola]|nr:putative glycoside hydrolase superfamily [Septoria linicola]
MRVQSALVLGLAASTQAAPVPGLIGDLFAGIQASVNNVVTTVTSQVKSANALANAVAKLGVTLKTDGDKAGSKFSCNQFVFNEIATIKKVIHDIVWAKQGRSFVNWTTYKANGVNLGAWLEQEQNYDLAWWAANVGNNYIDEWSWCQAVGVATCGPKLEARYNSFITKADIDKMGKLGINTLRIPTTYAAWVKVPGSQLYTGG